MKTYRFIAAWVDDAIPFSIDIKARNLFKAIDIFKEMYPDETIEELYILLQD